MPDCFYERMAEMKAWMAHSGKSVAGAEAGPFPEKCSVPVTVRGRTWFAHLLPRTSDGPASDGKIVLTGTARPSRAALLASGKDLPVAAAGDTFTIEVPPALRTALVDVIVIEWR
jgi:alpha-L-fucosidase